MRLPSTVGVVDINMVSLPKLETIFILVYLSMDICVF